MHFHCTQKLLKAFGLSPDNLDASISENPIFAWHAHIVPVMRSKTLVAINDQTFYTVILPGMKKQKLDNFADEFYLALLLALKSEGYEDHHADSLFGEKIIYAKTHSRQVLGVINDTIRHIRFHVERSYGWDHVDIQKLTKQINRTPWLAGTRKCLFAVEKLNADLKSILH